MNMTRNARTKQFRKEIQEEYFNNLIEECEKRTFYDNFEHIYDNKVIVEKAYDLGLIFWSYDDWEWWKEDNISNHPNLQLEWIEKFPDKDWNWKEISKNPNLQLEWIEKFPDKDWNWKEISDVHVKYTKKIKFEWIEKFPEKKWDWGCISCHENLRLEWIEKFPEKKWDWKEILNHPNLSLDWIEKKWDWKEISKHNKDWEWFVISRNPNFKFEWLMKVPYNTWYFFMCNSKFKILKANLISKKYENIILYSNYTQDFKIQKQK